MLVDKKIGPFLLKTRELRPFFNVPISTLSLQVARVTGVQPEVFVEGDSGFSDQAALSVMVATLFTLNGIQFGLQSVKLLHLTPYGVASLLELELFFGEELCLLIDAILDALESDFASHTEALVIKNIFAPLHPVSFYVGQQLFKQDSLVVELLPLLDHRRQIILHLGPHLLHGVVQRGRSFTHPDP